MVALAIHVLCGISGFHVGFVRSKGNIQEVGAFRIRFDGKLEVMVAKYFANVFLDCFDFSWWFIECC